MGEAGDSKNTGNGFDPRRESIGAALARARKNQGLSLHQVEQATKIRTRYLQNLEWEEYGDLPDGVYARGFLKTYANYLGLDGEEMARRFRERYESPREREASYVPPRKRGFDRPLVSRSGLSGANRRRFPLGAVVTFALSLLALVAVIGLLYAVGRGAQTEPTQAERVGVAADPELGGAGAPELPEVAPEEADAGEESAGSAEPTDSEDSAEAAEPTEAEDSAEEEAPRRPLPDVVEAALQVRGAGTLLAIYQDGVLVFEGTALPGFAQTYVASNEITVYAENASAVVVALNGRPVGALGQGGQPVTQTFTREDAAGPDTGGTESGAAGAAPGPVAAPAQGGQFQ